MKVKVRTLLVGFCVLALALCSYASLYPANAEQLKVGVINLNQVYSEYERVNDLRERIKQARQKLLQMQKEAQKSEGNREELQQKMNKIQNEINQERQKISDDIQKAGQKIAEQEDLPLVVANTIYKGPQVQTKDITQPVVEFLNKSYKKSQSQQ